jgi:hypothetical protein
MLNQLNLGENIFDFDYTSHEGDKLTLQTEYLYREINNQERPHVMEFLHFCLISDAWLVDSDGQFSNTFKKFASGIMNKDYTFSK